MASSAPYKAARDTAGHQGLHFIPARQDDRAPSGVEDTAEERDAFAYRDIPALLRIAEEMGIRL